MTLPLTIRFIGGPTGAWRILRAQAVAGPGLDPAERISVVRPGDPVPPQSDWILTGTTSNARYLTRREVDDLRARQAGLDRPEASCAALIPVRKSDAWWDLAQDERREIMEERSRHTAIGMDYLPQVARRLHHSRDLGEPFDFLTWFEFAPEHEPEFDAMLIRLRATPEWAFVEREVDIRLVREA